MIFVTVGHQMPFDRLVRAVDAWAESAARSDVFAQIGETDFEPQHIEFTKFLEPGEFRQRIEEADALVAHAGTGSILTALECGKPILVMPRRAELRETRNDHQVATAERFEERSGVLVASDESQIASRLQELEELAGAEKIGTAASPELLDALREFITQ